jgi:predicted nucleic acid-binding protein
MTIVVDASVAAKWLFREAQADRARMLLEESRAGRLSLLAPELLLAEVGNALWKRVYRERLRADEVKVHYARFTRLCPRLIRISGLTEAALHLALEHRHPVYDCLYVALALEASCDLVTADEKLHHAFSPIFPQVRLLRDWPV